MKYPINIQDLRKNIIISVTSYFPELDDNTSDLADAIIDEISAHYASIIEGKDKAIRYAEKVAHDTSVDNAKHLSIISEKDKEIAELKKELERRTDLIKEQYYKRLSHLEHSRQTLQNLWFHLCKEHNLQPIDKPTQKEGI